MLLSKCYKVQVMKLSSDSLGIQACILLEITFFPLLVLALSYKSVRICAEYLAYVPYHSTVVKYISICTHQHIHIHTYIFSDQNTEIQIAN